MKMPWESVIDGLIGLGSEFIEDKDKRNEFMYKTKELSNQLAITLIQTQTVPWVDATVKFMYALLAFVRPVGAFGMTAFGAYCHFKGISMDAGLHAVFDGAFPAWGVSRHNNKNVQQKEETKRKQIEKNSVENNSLIFPE